MKEPALTNYPSLAAMIILRQSLQNSLILKLPDDIFDERPATIHHRFAIGTSSLPRPELVFRAAVLWCVAAVGVAFDSSYGVRHGPIADNEHSG